MAYIMVALEGNPNTGKSTLFNALTGMKQHVGNWPGVTVEKKEGTCKFKGKTLKIVDLPGTYSLTAYSLEEIIARNFIIKGNCDVVVDVVNASNLERNLYLALQTLELTPNVVIALNMMDVARARGLEINVQKLSERLGVPVVPMEADKQKGIEDLLSTILAMREGKIKTNPVKINYGNEIESKIYALEKVININYPNRRWLAIKLLENDSEVQKMFKGNKEIENWQEDIETEIANRRYDFIDEIVKEVVKRTERKPEDLTDKIDRIVTHKLFGIPILFGIYAVIFGITFTLSTPLMDVVDGFFGWLGDVVRVSLGRYPEWFSGLVVDGIITGVGGVMVFFPVIAIFFALYSLLEDSGYLARAAFVMDKVMHTIGLHGKGFLTLFMAYGCNIPGIMGTRILESRMDRIMAILLNPLIPCAARLGVISFVTAVFFKSYLATFVMLSILLWSLTLIYAMGRLFKKFLFHGESPYFVMELPPYHKPTISGILIHSWERSKIFLIKAGTIIVFFSIVIWILSNYPSGVGIEHTYAGQIGRLLEPLGALMGFDWKILISLIFGFAAKEAVISTLTVIYGLEYEEALATILGNAMTPLVAYTFLVVFAIYSPCIAAVAIQKRELGSWKWTIFAVAYTLMLSFVVGVLIYNIGRFLGFS